MPAKDALSAFILPLLLPGNSLMARNIMMQSSVGRYNPISAHCSGSFKHSECPHPKKYHESIYVQKYMIHSIYSYSSWPFICLNYQFLVPLIPLDMCHDYDCKPLGKDLCAFLLSVHLVAGVIYINNNKQN